MSKTALSKSFKQTLTKANTFYHKNRPQIFTGIGLAGLWCAGVSSVVETPKFLKEKEEKKKKLGNNYRAWDTFVIGAKHYGFQTGLAALSTGLIILSDKEQAGKCAAAVSLASTLRKENDDLKAVLDEKLGKKKLDEVKEAYYEKRSKEVPVEEDASKLPQSKGGLTRILDDFLGYEFLASPGDILDAKNRFNADIINDGCPRPMDIKDFYEDYADIPITMKFAQTPKYKLMREFGFNSNNLLQIEFIANPDDLRPDSMIMVYRPVADYYQDDKIFSHNM